VNQIVLHPLKVLLVTFSSLALVSCIATNSPPKGLPKSDEELLQVIVSLAKRGHEALCNPQLVQNELGLVFETLAKQNQSTNNNASIKDEENQLVYSKDLSGAVLSGSYVRFASSAISYCQIGLRLKPDRLCQSSTVFEGAFTQKYQSSIPSPHGPLHTTTRMFQFEVDGFQTSVSIGNPLKKCANEFSISSKGPWK
jgi:hypothetical protein